MTFGALLLLAVSGQAVLYKNPEGPIYNGRSGDSSLFRLLPSWGSAPGGECSGTSITGTRGETVTFTRSSTAYCTKADGTMVSLTSNQPRVSLVSGAPMLLVEGAGTNLLLRSQELDNASWSVGNAGDSPTRTANASTAPDGTATAERIQYVGNPVNESVVYQTFVSTATTHTCSAYVKGNGGSGNIDLGIFQGTYAQSACAYTNGTWSRCTYSRVLAAANATPYLGCEKAGGALSTNCSGSPDVFVWGLQCEASSFATSYIATAGTSATRAAERASFTTPAALSNTAGCAAAAVYVPRSIGGAEFPRVIGWAANTPIYFAASNTTAGNYDSTNVLALVITSIASRATSFVSTWTGATKALTETGAGTNSGAYDGTYTDATTDIGSQTGTTNHLFGYVGNVRLGGSTTACDR
jgi:hypothetical protein